MGGKDTRPGYSNSILRQREATAEVSGRGVTGSDWFLTRLAEGPYAGSQRWMGEPAEPTEEGGSAPDHLGFWWVLAGRRPGAPRGAFSSGTGKRGAGELKVCRVARPPRSP